MSLTTGSGRFDLPLPSGHATGSLPVWYHLPAGLPADSRIVIVLHGTSRAARASRDNWVAQAEQHGFLLLTPEFELRHFPDPDYAYGKLWQPEPPHARLDWTASHCVFLDMLFEEARRALRWSRQSFTLYGHSAGAAFAHRYVCFAPQDRVELAVFANCGWYTFLDAGYPIPFGIADAGLPEDKLRSFLQKPVTILVGDRDRSGPYPAWWPEGIHWQGEHRVARSIAYFEAAKDLAERLNVPFNWQWRSVADVAHENARMIAPAARLIAEAWADQPASLCR